MLQLNLKDKFYYKNLYKDLSSVIKTREDSNYTQAKKTLENLVNYFSTSIQDAKVLETELRSLRQTLVRLEKSVVRIVIFGMVGKGKSSILNSLLQEEVFKTGALHGVTRTIRTANWKLLKSSSLNHLSEHKYHRIQLIDTPGLDEIDGKNQEITAYKIATKADLVLFAITEDISQKEFEALHKLQDLGKPIIIVFNKIDQYSKIDRLEIHQKICNERIGKLFTYNEIVAVAASPLISKLVKSTQGHWELQYLKGKPQIEKLKLKILNLLDKEGQSLIAFNSMLLADKFNQQATLYKFKIYDKRAKLIIQKASILKFIVIVFNPMIIAGLILGTFVDMVMILALSDLYQISITQKGVISLIRKLGISMISISISEFFISFICNSLEEIPSENFYFLSGKSMFFYLFTRIIQGFIAGFTCYMIGKFTKSYLINGAIWGPERPKKVIKNILTSLTSQSIFHNIQCTLRSKLKYVE